MWCYQKLCSGVLRVIQKLKWSYISSPLTLHPCGSVSDFISTMRWQSLSPSIIIPLLIIILDNASNTHQIFAVSVLLVAAASMTLAGVLCVVTPACVYTYNTVLLGLKQL